MARQTFFRQKETTVFQASPLELAQVSSLGKASKANRQLSRHCSKRPTYLQTCNAIQPGNVVQVQKSELSAAGRPERPGNESHACRFHVEGSGNLQQEAASSPKLQCNVKFNIVQIDIYGPDAGKSHAGGSELILKGSQGVPEGHFTLEGSQVVPEGSLHLHLVLLPCLITGHLRAESVALVLAAIAKGRLRRSQEGKGMIRKTRTQHALS